MRRRVLGPIAMTLLAAALGTVGAGLRAGAASPEAPLGARLRLALDRSGRGEEAIAPGLGRAASAARVDLLITGDPDPAALRRAGLRLRTRAGGIWTAAGPAAAVEALARIPGVERIALAAPVRPQLDVSVPAIHAGELRARDGDAFTGLTGKGVVVGILDSGLDLTHDDFRHPDGTTRVRYYWDQGDGGGPAPSVGGSALYGSEWSASDIDAGHARGTDVPGHGTWVAGVAAGDGSASDVDSLRDRFVGVAPEADLVVVALGQDGTITDADIIDGASYVFERAQMLGEPAVVNLSLGTQFGPHDGTSELDMALDGLAGAGRLLAASAGNDGDTRVHAELHVPHQSADSADVVVGPYSPRTTDADYFTVDAYYHDPDRFEVTVVAPTGKRFGPYRLGAEQPDTLTGSGTLALAHLDTDPLGSNLQVAFDLTDFVPEGKTGPAPPPAAGTWRIVFRDLNGTPAGGVVDLWVAGYAPRDPGNDMEVRWSGHAVDPGEEITSPGTAGRVITAGSFNTKDAWTDAGGTVHHVAVPAGADPADYAPGPVTPFSSRGPTRDGRLKPEVVAPGFIIATSLSHQLDPLLALRITPTFLADGEHSVFAGTSVSAPHLSGALALLLERYPDITPETARSRVISSARGDEFTGPVYNPAAGFGKLDAAALVDSNLVPVRVRELTIAAGSGGRPVLSWEAMEGDPVVEFRLLSRVPGGDWRERRRFPGSGPHLFTDDEASAGIRYRLRALLRTGVETAWAEASWAGPVARPALAAGPARPNPFSGEVEVPFRTDGFAAGTPLRVEVFDASGRRLRSWETAASGGSVDWDGTGAGGRRAPAGLYWMRFRAGGLSQTVKLVRIP